AEIFSRPELTRNTPAIKIADFLAGRGRNDCEAVVRNLYPPVDMALNWLGNYATARMTGTGSCIFAAFKTRKQAELALRDMPAQFTGFVTRSLNRMP
ncbi:MAG: 4-(cytidine 5'-diphospho)-2-C-methyl-D-erythritol kinase, partial [Pseudohongiellaceae bacterium]